MSMHVNHAAFFFNQRQSTGLGRMPTMLKWIAKKAASSFITTVKLPCHLRAILHHSIVDLMHCLSRTILGVKRSGYSVYRLHQRDDSMVKLV